MSVLVYVESWDGIFKKASFEALSYARELAAKSNDTLVTVCIGNVQDTAALAAYGAGKVINVSDASFHTFNNHSYATVLAEIAEKENADTIVLSNTNNGKSVAPLLAVKRQAAMISNALELPSSDAPFTVKRKAYSSKAFVNYSTEAARKVIAITPNAIGASEAAGSVAEEAYAATAADQRLTSVSIDKASGKIPLPEAELVVSAGRGLKGPENWGMVEELAELLGAGTACSKPVSDMGWRPHSEHVGQTGIAINPELYIAIGISGAIQHLAGVNSSKNIVAINIDPEAPFFKAADYGIVGDAFDVVPKLIEAVKAFKAGN